MNRRHSHVIDSAFPIALLFFFAASALAVLLLSARIYRETVADAEEHFTARTSGAYITEKCHQHDTAGGITLGELGGNDCLILQTTEASNVISVTYIYAYDGHLMELRTVPGVDIPPSKGTIIADIEALQFEQLDSDRIIFTVTDSNGNCYSELVSGRSAS